MLKPSLISIAPQDALDLTIDPQGKRTLTRGGMAANVAEASNKRTKENPLYIALHGKNSRPNARKHLELLSEAGIDLSKRLIHELNSDLGLNTCKIDIQGEEVWTQTGKDPLGPEIADSFLETINTALKNSQSSTVVLNSSEENRLGKDFLSKAAEIAFENNHIVLYNPCIHDTNSNAEQSLFQSGKLTLVKPNLDELIQFSIDAGIVSKSKSKEVFKRLETQVEKKDFKETLELARKLMKTYNYQIPLIMISLGKLGALFVSQAKAHYSSAPEIKIGATSAAGDTGIAGIVTKANRSKMRLDSSLDEADMYSLTREFVFSGAATAQKPNSSIANEIEIDELKKRHALYNRVL